MSEKNFPPRVWVDIGVDSQGRPIADSYLADEITQGMLHPSVQQYLSFTEHNHLLAARDKEIAELEEILFKERAANRVVDEQDQANITSLKGRLATAWSEITLLKDPAYCPICGHCGEIGCCGSKRCQYPTVNSDDVELADKVLQDTLNQLTAEKEKVGKLMGALTEIKDSWFTSVDDCNRLIIIAKNAVAAHEKEADSGNKCDDCS